MSVVPVEILAVGCLAGGRGAAWRVEEMVKLL